MTQVFLFLAPMTKGEPDRIVTVGRVRRKHPPLIQDVWFWAALSLGIGTCWLLALVLGRSGEWLLLWGQWRQLIWLIVLYPVIEEWLFRGVIQPRLLTKRYGGIACCGISVANVVVTLLFAGLHLFSHAPAWAALVIMPSLVYGWFRDRYNSVLPGALLHSGYNLGYFAFFGLAQVS